MEVHGMSENERVMTDREKVIKELEIIRDYDPMIRVAHDDVFKRYAMDALALLKSQEPRLVSEADFENADAYGYLPVWVAYKDGGIICDCITITAITNPDVTCDYRFWTSKPSDEQRKAVKWE